MNPTSPVNLSTYAKGGHDPGPWLRRAAWYLLSLVLVESAWPWPQALKRGLLRAFGARIGRGVVIKPRLRIKFPWRLSVGDRSWLGEEVWIDNLAPVRVGSDACLSQGACVFTGNHDRGSASFDLLLGPVEIGDGAWVGAKAILCPGARMEAGAILNAGSVGKGLLAAGGIYAGNPAQRAGTRVIRPAESQPRDAAPE